ncbi:MAG: BON domain-containing protein [Pseudomonadota bacterium]|nr:BON domain-containing protein [Pseudomonadota bacterium]
MIRRALLLMLPFLSLTISACTPVGAIVGMGAAVGVAAVQERSMPDAAIDAEIRIKVNDLWFRHNVDMFRKLNLSINEGRVLVTGVVPDPDWRVDAVRLVWQVNEVKEVINEIEVDDPNIEAFARDTWILAQLRGKMTFTEDIYSVNYNLEVVRGVVYLIGVARLQEELDMVIELARNIDGVKRVVSYVRVKPPEESPAK